MAQDLSNLSVLDNIDAGYTLSAEQKAALRLAGRLFYKDDTLAITPEQPSQPSQYNKEKE